jgi:hypothetical protein
MDIEYVDGFEVWSCGHRHQEGPDGRVTHCAEPATWYILRVRDWWQGYASNEGLQVGDLTLHTLAANERSIYNPATVLTDVRALRYADEQGRRLMLWHPQRQRWIPVMP